MKQSQEAWLRAARMACPGPGRRNRMPKWDVQACREASAAFKRFMADGRQQLVAIPREGLCGIFRPRSSLVGMAWRSLVLGLACAWFVPQSLKRWLLRRVGVKISRTAYLAPRVIIDPVFPYLIEIGDECLLGEGCSVWAHDFTVTSMRIGRVRLGKGAVVGGRAMVHCGVTVGEGAMIGACSLVTRNVPDGATVLGVPARRIPTLAECSSDASAPGAKEGSPGSGVDRAEGSAPQATAGKGGEAGR